MKRKIVFWIILLMVQIGQAQTAVNFNCNDCNGVDHDLFTELDNGKVIVICWVEPCAGCVQVALVSATLVETYNSVYPDKLSLYIVDDFANTPCDELISWASMYEVHPTHFFSDASISMLDYGDPGMPKVIVVADADHHVFYNENNVFNYSELEFAISSAINATFTRIRDMTGNDFSVQIFPNPCKERVTVSLNLKVRATIQAEIADKAGRMVYLNVWNDLPEGSNVINLSFPSIEAGIYFLKLSDGSSTRFEKLVIIQ